MYTQLVSAVATLTGVLAGCASMPPATPPAGIDHVVLAISSLERGIDQLGELCGVQPMRGGAHEHAGTRNALLGMDARAYLEVLAPQEGAELAPELQALRGVADLLPVSWAVAVGNAELTARMLRAHGYTVGDPQPGSRRTTDGGVVRWRTLEIVSPKIDGAPFFIEWHGASAHPAVTSPPGCPLLSLELHTPQDAHLHRLLGLMNVRGQVFHAPDHRMVITLQGPRGPVRLPAGS